MWIRIARLRPQDGSLFNLNHFDSVMCISAADYVAANEIAVADLGIYNPADLVIVASRPSGLPFVPLARIEKTGRQDEIVSNLLAAIANGLRDGRGMLDLMEVSEAEGFNFRPYQRSLGRQRSANPKTPTGRKEGEGEAAQAKKGDS